MINYYDIHDRDQEDEHEHEHEQYDDAEGINTGW
ncbi:hypothetical protein QFZ80_002260 [Paenibacillus sp. V4I7]|nr:hypothetical protein [Paenibacillus sp. V4I7]